MARQRAALAEKIEGDRSPAAQEAFANAKRAALDDKFERTSPPTKTAIKPTFQGPLQGLGGNIGYDMAIQIIDGETPPE